MRQNKSVIKALIALKSFLSKSVLTIYFKSVESSEPFRQLIITHQDRAAARQPGQSTLHNPAAGGIFLLPLLIEHFFADAPNVRNIAELCHSGFARGVVVAFVQTQMLRFLLSRFGSLNDDGVQRQG